MLEDHPVALATTLTLRTEKIVYNLPHIDFTVPGLGSGIMSLKIHIGLGSGYGVAFTHVALSVLCNIYSGLPRELSYILFDFSNIL